MAVFHNTADNSAISFILNMLPQTLFQPVWHELETLLYKYASTNFL